VTFGSGLRVFQASNATYGSSPNVVGGHADNEARRSCVGACLPSQEPVVGATIGGGGRSWTFAENRVTDSFGVVAGGAGNVAGNENADGNDAAHATVGGGEVNYANGRASTIAGGTANTAIGDGSTIAGGSSSLATGINSTIPGGWSNVAQGSHSFAAGTAALAKQQGCFVWADNSSTQGTPCDVDNAFYARAKGGFYMITGGTLGAYTGAHLAPGSTSWTLISDRDAKANLRAVDVADVLDKVVAMPISTWNWRAQHPSIRHMGPTAQDFRAAFDVGDTPLGINTVDADGVALAAIQGLAARDRVFERDLAALREDNAKLQDALAGLAAELRALRSPANR
jgi:hypothetical protein